MRRYAQYNHAGRWKFYVHVHRRGQASLNHRGKWQHQLPKHCVNFVAQKYINFQLLWERAGGKVPLSCWFRSAHSSHKKFAQRDFAQRALITVPNPRAARGITAPIRKIWRWDSLGVKTPMRTQKCAGRELLHKSHLQRIRKVRCYV
jgi:hypothetical protein